ncbi:hypothetical protein Baya_9899 [Bagarius yarrelli]|uniref:Uncharacterized protein n=1 Tax=Bagarius yarrelli TaxID=175774 RepID=A0A556U8Y1_BAGYA|nr:hypothetical protein Baya_9899 [Bagarius yarrelli]
MVPNLISPFPVNVVIWSAAVKGLQLPGYERSRVFASVSNTTICERLSDSKWSYKRTKIAKIDETPQSSRISSADPGKLPPKFRISVENAFCGAMVMRENSAREKHIRVCM